MSSRDVRVVSFLIIVLLSSAGVHGAGPGRQGDDGQGQGVALPAPERSLIAVVFCAVTVRFRGSLDFMFVCYVICRSASTAELCWCAESHVLLQRITDVVVDYLIAQAEAGAQLLEVGFCFC